MPKIIFRPNPVPPPFVPPTPPVPVQVYVKVQPLEYEKREEVRCEIMSAVLPVYDSWQFKYGVTEDEPTQNLTEIVNSPIVFDTQFYIQVLEDYMESPYWFLTLYENGNQVGSIPCELLEFE